ncbi:MAG: hypothetical protein QOE46_2086 [Acidobacteriota bacterium]|jgi:hypothetical protein|nr:hypothetical protein [Acidobacteriota bacterium]
MQDFIFNGSNYGAGLWLDNLVARILKGYGKEKEDERENK